MVDENGIAVVMKNNVPRYIIMEFSQIEQEEIAEQEDVITLSNRFINKNREAYEALAK